MGSGREGNGAGVAVSHLFSLSRPLSSGIFLPAFFSPHPRLESLNVHRLVFCLPRGFNDQSVAVPILYIFCFAI